MMICFSLPAFGQLDHGTITRMIDRLVNDQVEMGIFNDQVLVTMGDQIILNKSYGYADVEAEREFTGQESFFIASVTKQFTAALVLRAQDQGLLNVHHRLSDYLIEFGDPAYDLLTPYHLLTHSSGLVQGLPTQIMDGRLQFDLKGKQIPDDLLKWRPGSNVRYSSLGYTLLGMLLERLYGQSFATILDEQILRPLNMQSSGLDIKAYQGEFATGHVRTVEGLRSVELEDLAGGYAGAGMYSTAEDLHKWLGALANQDILSEASKQIMFKPFKNGYACGWLVETRDAAVTKYFHGGSGRAFQSVVLYGPKDNINIIILDNMGHRQAQWLGHTIWSYIQGTHSTIPQPFLSDILLDAAKARTLMNEVEQIRTDINGYLSRCEFDEAGINAVGYQLMAADRMDEAREVFAMNIEFYPHSSNAYDSMGEFEWKSGNLKAARKFYQKALEIDPDNQHAKEMLKRLRGRS